MSIISKQTRKTLGAAIVASLLSCVPVFAEDAAVKNEWETRVVANVSTCANIRSEATTDSEKKGVLPSGAVAEVLQKGEGWTYLVSGDIKGYIRNDLLAFGEEGRELYEAVHGNQETLVMAIPIEEHHSNQTTVQHSVSDGELSLMAAIIQCEAGGERHTGKVAVGAVILNRIRSSQFPNSITDVVYQSGQFSPVASGKLASVLSEGARSDCYDAAREALAGSNPVGDCLYFNSGSGKGIQIGNQHFF